MGKEVGLRRQPGCWLRSSHTFKECVTAHWSRGPAPKMNGAKTCHRSWGYRGSGGVGERTVPGEGQAKARLDGTVERMPA